MTKDQELLQWAAKAAGYQIDPRASFFTWRDSRCLVLLNPQDGHPLWNALDDDGDALRLAVALKLHTGYSGSNQYFAGPSDSDKGIMRESGERCGVGDPYAATRRAIVRAAAEIGKAMPTPTGDGA